MTSPLIPLPNLDDYRQDFIRAGVTLPLPTVPAVETGLLSQLPAPPPGKMGWPWTVETPPLPAQQPNGLPWPKVSVVMPSYNQADFVEQTIRSVLLQNYPNLEFVVCDGGSQGPTQAILEKYRPWLSFLHMKPDRGQGHAINLGFSLVSGEYLGWINSDDFYLPGAIQSIAQTFLDAAVEIVYGDSITLYDNDGKACYDPAFLVLDRYLRYGNILFSHAVFWRDRIHVPICETLNCAIDYELWLRLVPKRRRKHLKLALAVFRVQPQSKSSSERFKALWQADDQKIFGHYGPSPTPKSWRSYEFRWVQKLYKYLRQPIEIDTLEAYWAKVL